MKYSILSMILIALLLAACNGTFEIGLEHLPSVIPTQPVNIATDISQIDPSSTDQTENSLPPSTTSTQFVNIFLIALEDNGQGGLPVGCGDSVIPVQVEIPSTQEVLQSALDSLLSIKTQYYGESGLYNALYQSDLQIESLNIADGVATVKLIGTLLIGGVCDNPRIQVQLEQTVLQFPTISKAEIFINGKSLTDALSLKG